MMRNCDFWRFDEAKEMYEKYMSVLNVGNNYKPSFLEWLYKKADTAIQVSPDQVVQMSEYYPGTGGSKLRYVYVRVASYKDDSSPCIVGSTGFRTLNRVNIIASNGGGSWVEIEGRLLKADEPIGGVKNPEILKWPDVPEELMKMLAPKCGVDLGPVKDRCPFKDEWKTPVPPCMRKEGDGEEN